MKDIKYCTCRCWKISQKAADGSFIPYTVWEEYINSPEYKETIAAGTAFSCLTHATRDIKTMGSHMSPAIAKVVGKDDQMLLIESNRSPVARMTKMFIDGDWVCIELEILDETGADDVMKKNICRLKSLLSQGCLLGVSLVVVAFWDAQAGSQGDIARKIHLIKGCDFTENPSQRGARVIDVYDSERSSILESKTFSETADNFIPKVKTFSTSEFEELKGLPKTSKIDLHVTQLKVKEFSLPASFIFEDEKKFSVATVKERVRMAKLNPRQNFRRLMIDYKQAVRAAGGVDKMDPEDVKIMKSLFHNDVLLIVSNIHNDIMAGKQIATLIGASSISKNARTAAQKLQIPYRMAMVQSQKQGFVSKDRFQKIQDAYIVFVNSLSDEVFGQLPQKLSEPETPEDLEGGEE